MHPWPRARSGSSGTLFPAVLGVRPAVVCGEERVSEMAVELDPVLLEVLACPAPDHAPLQIGTPDDAEADALTCTGCGRVYPVRDGIPVLLLDEATLGPHQTAAASDDAGSAGPES